MDYRSVVRSVRSLGQWYGGVGRSVVWWGGVLSVRSVGSVGRSFGGTVGRWVVGFLVDGSVGPADRWWGGGSSVFRWGSGSSVVCSVGSLGRRSIVRLVSGAVGRWVVGRLFGGFGWSVVVRWVVRSFGGVAGQWVVWWGGRSFSGVVGRLVGQRVVWWGGGGAVGCRLFVWSVVWWVGRLVERWSSVVCSVKSVDR